MSLYLYKITRPNPLRTATGFIFEEPGWNIRDTFGAFIRGEPGAHPDSAACTMEIFNDAFVLSRENYLGAQQRMRFCGWQFASSWLTQLLVDDLGAMEGLIRSSNGCLFVNLTDVAFDDRQAPGRCVCVVAGGDLELVSADISRRPSTQDVFSASSTLKELCIMRAMALCTEAPRVL